MTEQRAGDLADNIVGYYRSNPVCYREAIVKFLLDVNECEPEAIRRGVSGTLIDFERGSDGSAYMIIKLPNKPPMEISNGNDYVILESDKVERNRQPEVDDYCLFWEDGDYGVARFKKISGVGDYVSEYGTAWKNCYVLIRASEVKRRIESSSR